MDEQGSKIENEEKKLLEIEAKLAKIEQEKLNLESQKNQVLARKGGMENELLVMKIKQEDLEQTLIDYDDILERYRNLNIMDQLDEEWKQFEKSWKKWKPFEMVSWMAYKLETNSKYLNFGVTDHNHIDFGDIDSTSNIDNNNIDDENDVKHEDEEKLELLEETKGNIIPGDGVNVYIDWKAIENTLIKRQLWGKYFLICDERSELEKIGLKDGNVTYYLVNAIKQLTLKTNDEMKEKSNYKCCCICYDNIVNTVILPCAHACLCNQCAGKYTQENQECPMCRSNIQDLIDIFI